MFRVSEVLCLMVIVYGVTTTVRAEGDKVRFDRDVRPILANHCYACHGPDAQALQGELKLSDRDDALLPAESGKRAIVPGDAAASELVSRILTADADEQMPPPEFKKPLTEAQRRTLKQWIEEGAEYTPHWSFVAPVKAPLPKAAHESESLHPIDRYVLTRLKSLGKQPSPPAERSTLIRRLYLDLIGIPPTPGEVDAFLADKSPSAYEALVDRLLADQRFGEKWARQWLDLARYADSNGFQRDGFRQVWAYRDWVIRALNDDKPYDRFVIEQLAGDLLPDATTEQRIATGFHRQVTINVEAGTNPEADRVNQVMDRVATTGTVFLGLTIECAQCHSHKYDPISQRDYYSLLAYFNNTPLESKYRGKGMTALDFIDGPAIAVGGTESQLIEWQELQEEYNKLLGDCDDDPTPEQKKALANLKKRIEKLNIQRTLVMSELPEPRKTHVMLRGQWDRPGESVTPAVLESLGTLPADAPPNRLGLARWIASKNNPLTARVAVNRWWLELFGRGLVATPEDFGLQGEPPTHPELLDWLAVELMEHGWSMKHILREIVTSATYRQSSRVAPELAAVDPDNALLARGPRFRLPSETIRDNALAIAGLLSTKMYGVPVYPPQPPGIWRVTGQVDNTYRTSQGEDRYRRGIYTIWRRSAHYPSFANFDAPNRGACVANRPRSNTPLQALTLLNDDVYVEAAAAFAARIIKDCPEGSLLDRVNFAFRLAVARKPTDDEAKYLASIFEQEHKRYAEQPKLALPAGIKDATQAAWFYVATILLNLDETITKE